MTIKNKFKKLFKKEKEEPTSVPYSRGIIVFTEVAEWKGIEDDMNKVIKIIEGDKVVREYPYDEILVEKIEEVEKIPIDDLTIEPTEIKIKGEIDPLQIKFKK